LTLDKDVVVTGTLLRVIQGHVVPKKQAGVLQHQSSMRTLWNEEGLASSYSGIDEPASCGVSPVCIFFNEPK